MDSGSKHSKHSGLIEGQHRLTSVVPGPVTTFETVTPEMAAEWLKANTSNRPLNAERVAEMAAAMRAGEWRETHQGPAFDKTGRLIDGQHRLHAVVRAGVAVRMSVTRNLPTDALEAIDTGVSRRAHHILAMSDRIVLNSNERGALSAAHALTRRGDLKEWSKTTSVRKLRECVADFGEALSPVMRVLGKRHNRLCQGPMLGSLLVMHKFMPAAVEQFASLLSDPSGLHMEHPAMNLREFVLQGYSPRKPASRDDLSGRTFAAVAAFAKGETRKVLHSAPAVRTKMIARWCDAMGREAPKGDAG